jgi:hypothetical protein
VKGVTPRATRTLKGRGLGRDGAAGVERDAVESLLNGDAREPVERDVLLRLLAAASAPGRPGELAGEEAAVHAFRRPDTTPLRRPGRRALLAKLLTVKVAAALAVTALGGATVAAATGTLPRIPGTAGFGAGPTAPTSPATPPRKPVDKGAGAGGPAAPASSPSTSPSPSVADLCRAFVTDVDSKPPKDREKTRQLDLKNPIYAPLVVAAGGKGRAMPYCVRLLKTPDVGDTAPPGVSPTSRPTTAPGGDPDQFITKSTPTRTKTKPPHPHRSKPVHSRNAGPASP